MPVTGEDLLTLADQLSSLSGEAAHRAAISRAYYALYHAIEASLSPAQRRLRERFKQRYGPHDSLWEYLKNLNTDAAIQLSQAGKELLTQRITADYAISADITETDAISVVLRTYAYFDLFR